MGQGMWEDFRSLKMLGNGFFPIAYRREFGPAHILILAQ